MQVNDPNPISERHSQPVALGHPSDSNSPLRLRAQDVTGSRRSGPISRMSAPVAPGRTGAVEQPAPDLLPISRPTAANPNQPSYDHTV